VTSNPAIIDRDRLRSGGESEAAADTELDEYLHLYMVNRGVLMTPFHNMALMCPATSEADADAPHRHLRCRRRRPARQRDRPPLVMHRAQAQ